LIRNLLKNNVYFFIPFAIWLIVGAFLLSLFTQDELFFFVNSKHSFFFDKVMTVLSAYGRGDCIPIVLTSLLLLPGFRNKKYLIASLSFAVVTPLLAFYFKDYYNCSRPLTEYGIENVHTVPWLENAYMHSFPSGHTLGAFSFFLLLSLFLPKSQKAWSTAFFMLALGCAYSRMYLGQHFFKDIYAGSIFGVFIIAFIYLVAAFISLKTTKK
jgi:membrane-associated phospholipid phosphatase